MTRNVLLRVIVAVIIIVVLGGASVIINRANSLGAAETPSGFFH